MKVCTKCKLEKDESDFYKKSSTDHGHSWCKQCRRADSKRWREENPERYRQRMRDWKQRNPTWHKEWRDSTHYQLKHVHNVTKEEWDAQFEKQGHCCAVCKADTPTGRKNGRWHTDHDHVTGELRGILCGNCNLGLGNFQDNAALPRLATTYLEHPPWQSSAVMEATAGSLALPTAA